MNLGEDDRQIQAERMLIEEIKKRPYLWNETLPEHKDMEKARDAWDAIGRMFGMSGTCYENFLIVQYRHVGSRNKRISEIQKWKNLTNVFAI